MRPWGHRIVRAAAVAALVVPAAAGLVSSACGGLGSGDNPDAGSPSDGGGPLCEMVVEYAPSSPEVGATVDLDGSIYKQQVSGFESYEFTVTRSGAPVATTDRSPFDGSKVSFVADQPGPYRVELRGDVDGLSCTDGVITINVTDAGTPRRRFRFHFVPALGQPAPQQDLVFEVPGLAPYDLGTVGLDTGIAVAGTVSDAGGSPRAAYLRFTRQSDGAVTEAFANATGAYTTRLADGTYDLLAVPDDPSLAPRQVSAVASVLGELTLTAGDTVTGTVRDSGGAPIAGAQVALRIAGVPSAVGTTDGTGVFSLAAHLGGAAALTVTPPAASGLPRLEVDASAGLTPSTGVALAIAYAAGLTSRTLAFDVTTAGGAAAPGASVTFVRRASANAGTITPAGGSAVAAAGGLRITAEGDGTGHVSGLIVPDGVYDVIARSAGGAGVTLKSLDLSTGQPSPSAIALAVVGTVSGTVAGGGNAVAGVQVVAAPRGLLASEPGAAAMAVTDAGGAFALPLVGGGTFDLTFEPQGAELGRARLAAVAAPAAGGNSSLGQTDLAGAIAVSGKVAIPGVAVASGVSVLVFCDGCSGPEASLPIAEGVTGPQARFTVALPDPADTSSMSNAK